MKDDKKVPLPWEQRGYALYVPNTQKRVLEVPIAYKTSEQAQATIDYVARVVSTHDDALRLLRVLLSEATNAGPGGHDGSHASKCDVCAAIVDARLLLRCR